MDQPQSSAGPKLQVLTSHIFDVDEHWERYVYRENISTPILCPIGSGPRHQILSHVFARCASQKTYGHARIACDSGMAVGFFFAALRRLAQRAKKCDTNHIPRATA